MTKKSSFSRLITDCFFKKSKKHFTNQKFYCTVLNSEIFWSDIFEQTGYVVVALSPHTFIA